jgi:Flp pilus assembly protein TadG
MIEPGTGRHTVGQTGSMTVELVVLAPVVVLFALVAIGLGRVEQARQELADAARAGAEAASVVSSSGQAPVAAANAAVPALADQAHVCASPTVNTDTSLFGPPGRVQVTVVCHVGLSDVLPGVPGSISLQATQSAPVDPYRAVQ